MSEIRVRQAAPADDAALARLDHETWSTLHSVMPCPEPAGPFFDLRHEPGDYLVALDGERVVGFLRLVPASGLACHAHVWQIQGLAVDPAARGRGAARALLAAAADRCRRSGARRITLRVLGHNAPARRLYESAGYAVEGVLPAEFLLDGRYVNDVLMAATLT